MKSKKFFITVSILTFIFLLVSCSNNHVHLFSEDYNFDEKQHWFIATCEHEEEKGQPEDHTFSEWSVKTQKSCTNDEVLKRFCMTCFYEETKTGEKSSHNLETADYKSATCLEDGHKAYEHCTLCDKYFDKNGKEISNIVIEKLQHSFLEEWQYDETNHYKVCVNGCTDFYDVAAHNFVEIPEVPATCKETGTIAYKECSVCHAKYDLENNFLDSLEDLTIPAKNHTYSTDWSNDDTYHWHQATCEHSTEISEKAKHSYDNTGKCVCGKEVSYLLLGSHAGTSQWDMTADEKISSNAIFHQNVSNVAVDAESNIVDFSLQIQYKGWENNGEKAYFFTIKSENGVLTLDNQLGISPWGYTTFTLKEEHKIRLASAEGLDFVVQYNHEEQKLQLYIYTNHKLEKLYEMNTYFGSMSNFYKFVYKLTGTATVNTTTYNTYDTSIDTMYEELGLALTKHNVLSNVLVYDENSHWNPCVGCDVKNNEVEHSYDSTTSECVCGKTLKVSQEEKYTLISSHEGTSLWDMAVDEKISSNAIFHQNVSNVAVDAEGNIVDFSLQIQYKGWENNGEKAYFFTIKSENGVLTLDNQLGISPWGYTTFTLKEEHKTRLASAEGLDFFVCYEHNNQKLALYIVTDGNIEKLYEMNTYFGKMDNFYKFVYKLIGTATVNTTTYTVSSEFDPMTDLLSL